ncbi:hypothetical protein HK101_010215 [Irineochytrium annulatum]|nr:hypothetical protein HK101_010215 [Irineochytrium annulatum]
MKFTQVVTIAAVIPAVLAGGGGNKKTYGPIGNIKNIVLVQSSTLPFGGTLLTQRRAQLCMENRSFDHFLGYWARTRQGVEAIPNGASNVSPTGETIYSTDKATYISTYDPDHAVLGVTEEIYGPNIPTINAPSVGPATMSGFVMANSVAWNTTDASKLHEVIDGFNPAMLPITTTLASEYAVFDHWYAGVPGPTFPNRAFIMSATSNGMYFNSASDILSGFPQKSIFGALDDAKVSWKNYFGQVPTSLVFKDVRNIPDVLTKLHTMNTFYSDVASGNLPAFSMIDPILFSLPGVPANDNHPPHDIARGELLIKNIYEALRAGPNWHQTLFIITYDEHGGFYDHVSPPDSGIPSPDAASASSTVFKFDRLGVRVPTIMISPWIKKGTVMSFPSGPTANSKFEHSSFSATIKKEFGLDSFLTQRDAWAGSFESVYNLTSPRTDCLTKLPAAPQISLSERLTRTAFITDQITDIENEFEEIVTIFKAIVAGKTP